MSTSKIVVRGASLYLRSVGRFDTAPKLEAAAVAFAKRCLAMRLSWLAIGAIWQDVREGKLTTGFINTPTECHAYARALRNVGIEPFVWGYPWINGEDQYLDGMAECAGDEKNWVLDPELGMNPTRGTRAPIMAKSGASATKLVHGARAKGAEKVILSTFGGIPPWFPLEAFLDAGVDGAGGQTYTDDDAIDTSIAYFKRRVLAAPSDAQIVPNFGLYSRDKLPDGSSKVRAKTPAELGRHLNEFLNENEGVCAAIGWAENFLTPANEKVIAEWAPRLAAVR